MEHWHALIHIMSLLSYSMAQLRCVRISAVPEKKVGIVQEDGTSISQGLFPVVSQDEINLLLQKRKFNCIETCWVVHFILGTRNHSLVGSVCVSR